LPQPRRAALSGRRSVVYVKRQARGIEPGTKFLLPPATTYAILMHNGIELDNADLIGALD
jgi:hypothetical protein